MFLSHKQKSKFETQLKCIWENMKRVEKVKSLGKPTQGSKRKKRGKKETKGISNMFDNKNRLHVVVSLQSTSARLAVERHTGFNKQEYMG